NRHASDAALLSEPLIDQLPAGLVVATPSNATTTCASGLVEAASDTGTVRLSGPVSIAAQSTCTVSVDVTSSVADRYYNVIPAGALKTSLGDNAVAATATLKVGYDFPEPYCHPKFHTGVE